MKEKPFRKKLRDGIFTPCTTREKILFSFLSPKKSLYLKSTLIFATWRFSFKWYEESKNPNTHAHWRGTEFSHDRLFPLMHWSPASYSIHHYPHLQSGQQLRLASTVQCQVPSQIHWARSCAWLCRSAIPAHWEFKDWWDYRPSSSSASNLGKLYLQTKKKMGERGWGCNLLAT